MFHVPDSREGWAQAVEIIERMAFEGRRDELLILDFEEAVRMIRDGRITDAKSVAALLWVERWGRGGAPGAASAGGPGVSR